MLGIGPTIGIFLCAYIISEFIEEGTGKALLYATLITLTVTGIYTVADLLDVSFIVATIVAIIFFILLIFGDDFIDALLQATLIIRIGIIVFIGVTIILPIVVRYTAYILIQYWPTIVLGMLPVVAVGAYIGYLAWGPTLWVWAKYNL